MRSKLFIVLFLFCCVVTHAQSGTKPFYLEIPSATNIPTVVKQTGQIKLVFSNSALTNMFDDYLITDFKLAFPGANTPTLSIVYIINCAPDLLDEIDLRYSSYFGRHEEIQPMQELYVPNDYDGVGGTLDQSYLDLIQAQAGWDLSKGDNAIVGIGEAINVNQEELSGKSETVYGSSVTGTGTGHGTQVAVAMAGSTDNGVAISSIGFNSEIKAGGGWSALVPLADAGARAINLSWGGCNTAPLESQYGQDIVDLLWARGVIVVAAAGNGTASCSTLGANAYHYPAALNKVFAVTSVGHRAPADSTTDGNRQDIFPFYNSTFLPPSQNFTTTYNDRVDLSAPGYDILTPGNSTDLPYVYNLGTSVAAPLVTGTIGLMVDANPCLYPDEIESILKLTSVKNDLLTLNLPYTGQIGVGRLNAYRAVEMADAMQTTTGIVNVHDRILDRFDYDLRTNPYAILMTNNTVTGNTTIDFTAKNYIDTVSGDYNPGSGWVEFKINALNDQCNTPVQNPERYAVNTGNDDSKNKIKSLNAKLYPNPNEGKFTVLFDKTESGTLQIAILDVLGKTVYNGTSDELSSTMLNVPELPSGLYFLRLEATGYSQTIKFVKQ